MSRELSSGTAPGQFNGGVGHALDVLRTETGALSFRLDAGPLSAALHCGWLAEGNDAEDEGASRNAAAGAGYSPLAANRTVLVADDDDLVRAMITLSLEDAGYEVVEVADGSEALAFLEKSEPGIAALVSDIRMPGLDGLALTRTVAQRWPRIAIVLVSGFPTGGRMTEVPEAAVFVSKPFRQEELARAVERALTHKSGH